MDEEMNLTPEEKEAFKRLAQHKFPNAKLEESTINQLKINKLIMDTKPRMNYAAIVAASVLMFIAGYFTNRWTTPAPDLNSIPSDYMLLLGEDDNFRPDKSEEEIVNEYRNWLISLREKGIGITGAELGADDSRDPSSLAVSGFFMLKATSLAEAQQIASQCPHKKYGGTVSVRELIKH